LHLLWRLFAPLACARHGLPHRAHASAPALRDHGPVLDSGARMTAPLILLSAGGTGGHLFPAEALANALKAQGARVALATDKRANAYAGSFPADGIVGIPSA